jgi:HEXXH motif-containing protein
MTRPGEIAAITTIGAVTVGPSLETDDLSLRLVRLGLRRLRRTRRSLVALPRGGSARRAVPVLDGLLATLRTLPRPVRDRVLVGPDIRGFLAEAETWIEVARLSRLLLARSAGGRPATGRTGSATARLFDLVCRTQHLGTLVPRGRLDSGFARRCARLAAERLDDATFDLAALLLGLRLACGGPAPLSVVLRFREDAEQGRPRDRIDLGTLAGPAGPLAILLAGPPGVRSRRGGTPRRVEGRRVRATLRGARLDLTAPGAGRVIVPAAGMRLLAPDPAPGARRGRAGRRGAALRLQRRNVLPGTSIVLAPVVLSSRRRPRVLRESPGLGPRLAGALRMVRLSWPEAHREIERRTFMVVPIREPGTVSYSMAARPGVSFINVSGKSRIDLADDLLHETAHHRLHDLQATVDLLVPGPETLEVQAFESPWRGARRPLHGLLHGAYTFLFRAELFRRLLRAQRGRMRPSGARLEVSESAFVRRELRRERRMIASALRDLEGASRSGLLTPAGRRLVRGMRSWFARLGRVS